MCDKNAHEEEFKRLLAERLVKVRLHSLNTVTNATRQNPDEAGTSSTSEEGNMNVNRDNLAVIDIRHRGSNQDKNVTEGNRHCAFCLKICGHPAKVCAGCKKRAYCSKECQKADWSVTGKGQRHKNWCGKYECGEEDVEWEVVPVRGQGLGIVAKKFMPAKYRIIVEPVFTHPSDHPGLVDLAPEGKSLEYKFQHNALEGDPARDFGAEYVALRISRVNHSCKPNTGHIYDEIARVEILFAEADIYPGEEICIMYGGFPDLFPDQIPTWVTDVDAEFQLYKIRLMVKWNIRCPPDCFCNDPKARRWVVEARSLLRMMVTLHPFTSADWDLQCAEKILEIQENLNCSLIKKAELHFFAFDMIMIDPRRKRKAVEHIQAAFDIFSAIRPFSELTRMYETLLKKTVSDVSLLEQQQKRRFRF